MKRFQELACLVMLAALLRFAVGCSGERPREIHWGSIPDGALAEIPFTAVDRGILDHPYEKRGLVRVPLDYSNPSGRQIEIFYRLMPSTSSAASEPGGPILLFMNGGPGVPSSSYRSLGYDYESKPEDTLGELSKHFRILAVDQRGTGCSAPLDLDDPRLSPQVMARLFDSDEHARDHARVVEAVVPRQERFFILARSYGGEIAFQYLTLQGERRLPAGFIFDSAVLPHSDALETFLMRRQRQKELNLALREKAPEIVAKLGRLRGHLEGLGMEGASVNFLWPSLGGAAGWESDLERRVDELLVIDSRERMEADLGQDIRQSVNLLNYVLSSAALTPGYTDRTMIRETSRRIPFEDWMLDENWTLAQIGNDGTWREGFIAALDRNPPPPTRFPPLEEIRRALGQVQSLFTFGKSDAFLPQDLQIERARRLHVPGRTQFRVFEAGHGAAFSAEGASFAAQWASRILNESP